MMTTILPAAISFKANWILIGVGIIVLFAFIALIAVFIPWLQDFRHELKYINIEIERSEGREKQHWIKKKKRLWRSILPFCHYHGH